MSINYNTSDNTPQNHFVNPPEPGLLNAYQDNNVYVIGSTIDLSWQTNYTSIEVLLWQNGNNSVQELPPSGRYYACCISSRTVQPSMTAT